MRDQIFPRQDRVHAGECECRFLFDGTDRGVAVRAAHEGGFEHSGEADVVDETTHASEQFRIFEAVDPSAENRSVHADGPFPVLSRLAASRAAATMPW